jgi:hypothetical protein
MTQTQNLDAVPPAAEVPESVRDEPNSFRITLRRCPAQAAAAKKRRRISRETWGSLRAAIAKEHQALPPDSPRLQPTLARLRWLEPAVGMAAVGGG